MGHLGSSMASHTSQTERQRRVADSSKAWWQMRSGLCIIVAITLGEFRPQLRWKSFRVNTPCCFSRTFQAMSCLYRSLFARSDPEVCWVQCLLHAASSAVCFNGRRRRRRMLGSCRVICSQRNIVATSTAAYFCSLFPVYVGNLLIHRNVRSSFWIPEFLLLDILEQ